MENHIPIILWEDGSIWFKLKYRLSYTWMMIKKDYILRKRIKKVQKYMKTQDKEAITNLMTNVFEQLEKERFD